MRYQVLRGRNSPSGWKIKYLLHLQEYLIFVATEAERTAKSSRRLIHPPMILSDHEQEVYEPLTSHLRTIEGIASDLRADAHNIDGVVRMIKEQMDLSQSFWNTVLAFVVAIYVPLSFASVS